MRPWHEHEIGWDRIANECLGTCRFHAWQSALVFAFLFVVHLIFSWSSILSWLIFVGDLCLIALLTFRAYVDATTLDRYEVPFFGPLASSILDDE